MAPWRAKWRERMQCVSRWLRDVMVGLGLPLALGLLCLPELRPGARTALPSVGLHPTLHSSDPLVVSLSFPAKPQPGRSSSPGLPEPPKGANCSLLPSRSATGWWAKGYFLLAHLTFLWWVMTCFPGFVFYEWVSSFDVLGCQHICFWNGISDAESVYKRSVWFSLIKWLSFSNVIITGPGYSTPHLGCPHSSREAGACTFWRMTGHHRRYSPVRRPPWY